jgi:YegS/Rv2252/BmrU family lipid kinase
MDLLIVANPSSGKQWRKDVESMLTGYLQNRHISWELLQTTGSGDAERIHGLLEKLQPKAVVAVGGDGTLNLVATQLIHTDIPMGIVPTGSANGLAYNLEIPSDVEQALQIVLNHRARAMDVLLLNDSHLCLHLADVGVNARVVKRFEEEGSGGIGGYALHLLKEVSSKKEFFRFHLKQPHETKEIKAEMLVISNAKSYGTGALINPEGRIDDGKFELILIKPYPWWYVFRLLLSAFSGKLHKMQHVRTISTSEALIAFKEPVDLQVDGEVMEGIRSLKIQVLPGALKVLH